MKLETRDIFAGTAILVSVVTFALSYLHTWRSSILSIKPVLVFAYDGGRGWALRNVGNGPALNIIVAEKPLNSEWTNPIRIPPIPKEGEFVLCWLGHTNISGLGATYTDFRNRPYSATCQKDLSRTFDGLTLPSWTEDQLGKHWEQPGCH